MHRSVIAFGVLASLLAGPSVSLGQLLPSSRTPERSFLTHVEHDTAAVILGWNEQAARNAWEQRQPFRVEDFTLRPDRSISLELTPFSVTGADTRFMLGHRDLADEPIAFNPADVLLFRGKVSDQPNSHVFLAFSAHGSTGYVDFGPGAEKFTIASYDPYGEPLDTAQVAVSAERNGAGLPGVPICGNSDSPDLPDAIPGLPGPRGGTFQPGLKHIELAVETDFEYYSLFGDLDAACAYLVALYGAVSDIFIRDTHARVELVFARLWDDPNDLFNDVEPSPLPDFRSYWNTNMGAVSRDVAQLLSGRRDYPFGGQAYLSSLCVSTGYSVVGYTSGFFPDPNFPSPYHYDVSVTAHELGHNCGTGHTHSNPNNLDTCDNPATTPQRGTIMSYCGQTWSGQNANRDLYFHTRIVQNIQNYLQNPSCVIDDCNMNGLEDSTELSIDVNGNNIPDECEDCDNDTILDDVEILGGSLDLNGNGIPDECEPDCNNNNVPDDKDIADGTSDDAYGNAIPDECETDCDGNSTSDYTQIQADMSLDVDRNAVLDSCQDCDNDTTTDHAELSSAHNLWLASGLDNSMARQFFATSGVLTQTSSGSLVQHGQDVVISPTGQVLVSSADDDRILAFDTLGVHQSDFVSSGSGGLDEPAGMAFGPDGNLYVSSTLTNDVRRYNGTTGVFIDIFASGGGLTEPFGLTFGPDGDLYVTSGSNEVMRYDGTTGTFDSVFVAAAANGGLDQPRGLVFKSDGNLLVCSFGTDEVLEYTRNTGTSLGKWAQVGTATRLTQISPWGIRVAPNGNVFVVKTGEDYGSSADDHHHDDHGEGEGHGTDELHLTNAQMYEYDVATGNFIRTHIGGNDHGHLFPTGFDFVPGWHIDCNLNLLPDSCDIASGFSRDADFNNVPDECETDCNTNSIQDRLDIIPYGTSGDCNFNLVPDECEITAGQESDCNANGRPDACDLADGTSADCDFSGIPDSCEKSDVAMFVAALLAGPTPPSLCLFDFDSSNTVDGQDIQFFVDDQVP